MSKPKSKLNKTENYRGPSSPEDDPMNETMVRLILKHAGFNSVEEVRKIAKEEDAKARSPKAVQFKEQNEIVVDEMSWQGNWKKRSERKEKPLI